ncbi:MAG TPA: serine O-acetyltransferase, partial [Alphaproteobacteria bacterium]|nr:serine O-acetyltransferase [Alphaproteobacteria bacterium]
MSGPAVIKELREIVDVVLARDPAARSRLEVVLAYPGFHALLFHRLANAAWRRDWRLLGRLLSHIGRMLTGIEIHPGATLGRRLFIDHGMGLVVGETAVVGDDVTLYHGVTLGGTSLARGTKRHPTIADGVIVGAGAQVLGNILVGAGARIGANAVVVTDVPPGATMVGIPAKEVGPRAAARDGAKAFVAYGTPCDGDLPDPIAQGFCVLREEIERLRQRVSELEGDRHPPLRIVASDEEK